VTPLRVTLELETPFAEGPHPAHLDDIVAWAAVQQAMADGAVESFDAVLNDLPFERHEQDGHWCWKASMLWPERRLGTGMAFVSRKFDAQGFSELFEQGMIKVGKEASSVPDAHSEAMLTAKLGTPVLGSGVKAGAIDIESGHQKNYSFLYPVVSAPSVVGFCVGDRQRIADLLGAHLKHFGKRASRGHGRVGRIIVDEDLQALSLWEQRNLPWPREGYEPVAAPARPPYWDRSRNMMVWRPTRFTTFAEPPEA
jgi:CRISPR type IV-associated protein Csf3